MFSLVGGGVGLRSPVHVDDLAQVAVAAMAANPILNPIHDPGGERLTFREVVRRIAIGANIRYIEIPMTSFPFFLGARHLEILVASAALWQLACVFLKISMCQMMLRFLVFQEGCSIPML